MNIRVQFAKLNPRRVFHPRHFNRGASKSKIKNSALVFFAFGPYRAAVPLDYPVDSREPYPRARELVLPVEALERVEELLRILHLETGAIVLHEKNRFAVPDARGAYLYPRCLPVARELPCVPDKVLHRYPQEAGVSRNRKVLLNDELGLALRLHLSQGRGNGPCHSAQIAPFAPHLRLHHLRKLEERVDELPHALACGLEPPQVIRTCRVQLIRVVLQEHQREAADDPERGFEVVRHAVAEGLELFVSCLELIRPPGYSLFELDV